VCFTIDGTFHGIEIFRLGVSSLRKYTKTKVVGGEGVTGGKLDIPPVFSSSFKARVKSRLALHNFQVDY
jgi:hypothetical protein